MACPSTHTRLGFQWSPVRAFASTAGKGRSGLGGPGNRRARSDGNQHHPRAGRPGHAHVRHPPEPRSRDRARTTNTRRNCGRSRSLTILETALRKPRNLLESAGQTAHFRFRGRDKPPPTSAGSASVRPGREEGVGGAGSRAGPGLPRLLSLGSEVQGRS